MDHLNKQIIEKLFVSRSEADNNMVVVLQQQRKLFAGETWKG